jgi:DNA-binding winged helix-turn-helix (wHTH) protein
MGLPGVEQKVLRFGEFEIDTGQHALRRGSLEIELRQKVFQVLVFLLANRGRVVSKEELLAEVWGGTSVTDDVVFRAVIDIRAALGDDRRRPRFVKTVPKVGYRFIAEVNGAAPHPPPARKRRWLPLLSAAALALCSLGAAAGYLWTRTASRPPALPVREVAWWRLDDISGTRVTDVAGSGLSGAIAGSPARLPGVAAGALAFDGSRQYIEGADRPGSLPSLDAPRSVAAWVNSSTTNGDDTNIFLYGETGWPMNRHFHLLLDQQGRAAFGYGSTTGLIRGASPIVDGKWHLLCGVYEGPATNLAHLYVDGVHQTAAKLPEAPRTTSRSRWMIGGPSASNTCFRGAIDDVRVFARALLPAEAQALYRCSARIADAPGPRGPVYFLPVASENAPLPVLAITPAAGGLPASIRKIGPDLAGIQFASSQKGCAINSVRGADVGQDLYMSVELKLPRAGDRTSSGGPYFRSRRAAAGDGLVGGTSAGYWVQLDSAGVVRVRRLNPHEVVAFTQPRPGFDPGEFHRLEIAVQGTLLQAALDGSALAFDQAGRAVTAVAVPPAWDGPPAVGRNQGAAGIFFMPSPRGELSGEEARNIVVAGYRPLGVRQ